ncbi:MAG: tetratricopeptide repeat protein, partial [Kiritimatiellaeota bacterium]|nr:tetratricopeptide repeat protein [Kiritimatiellota bacterium]
LWSHYALHTGMTALTLMALLGAFASPWFISQSNPRAMIPLFSYALVAMTAGYLLAYGWLLMTVRRGSRSVVDPNSPVFLMGRPMGQILFIALAAGAAAAGALNYVRNVDGSKERFLNEVAGGVVDRLEGRDWIILNTKVDSNYMEFYLRHLARKDDRELNVINMFAPERHRAAITANIRGKLIGRLPEAGRQSMVNSLNLGVSTFITDLYGRYPGFTTTNVVNWGFPDMIMNSGIRPVPEFAYFGSGLSWKGKTAHEMLGEYEAFLERMDALLPHTKEPVALLDHLRNDLRRHMGFLMNNYGVALADSPTAETPQAEKDAVERAAYAFFKRVVAYSPENISARINVFQIAATSKLPDIGAEKEAVGDELQDFADGLKNRYTLYAITSHFGYVRSRQIYEMILKMYTGSPDTQNIAKQFRDLIIFADGGEPGGGSFADGSPEARVDTLERSISESPKEARHYIEIVRLCIRLNRMEDAEKWIREAERQNFGIDFAFEQATLLLAAGKTGEARQILQGLVESKPKNYEALSLLSFIMMDQQDVTGVQRYVLDKIEREEGSRKGYHYQLVSGKLAMLKAAMALAAKNENEAIELQRGARDHFHNAFKTRPQVEALSTLVLELDFALGDSSKARGHATEFLRRDRNHPAANWVLGSLLFQDGDYLAAEEYFKQSIEARVEKKLPPDARSLNDYAEVLRRLNRPVESERHAREALAAAAVEKSPRYASAAYDTLARAIYAQGGRLAEAKAASDEAVRTSLENKIPLSAQFKLTQLQIAVARNAVDEAKTLAGEIQDEVARRQDALDKEERMEFNKLRDLAAKM